LEAASGDASLAALRSIPPEKILLSEEIRIYKRLFDEKENLTPAFSPQIVMVMKATRLCNLRCTYCNAWREGPNQSMSFEVLARATRDVLRAPGQNQVEFVWHGGEVTLLPRSFYHKALWLQQMFKLDEQDISNSVQTNGTLLTKEWADFLKKYKFSVGISLDGPPQVNDYSRVDRKGQGTSARVSEGIRMLDEANVPYGILMVVDDAVVKLGSRVLLDYFVSEGNSIKLTTRRSDQMT